jgi:hypothetical protein
MVAIALTIGVMPAFSADACFMVHGRLNQSNGVPSFRLWPTGAKRILGVLDCKGKDESPNAIPAAVKKLAGPYVSVPVFGDYKVCPLTKERAGQMRMVCIETATNLSVRNRH